MSVAAPDIGQELDPLVFVELADGFLLLFGDARKLEGVEQQLLQVGQVQVPRQVDRQVVQSSAPCVPEALVVRVDADLDALLQKAARRVAPQVVHVAEHVVGQGAALEANVLFFHNFDQVRVSGQREPVPNAL